VLIERVLHAPGRLQPRHIVTPGIKLIVHHLVLTSSNIFASGRKAKRKTCGSQALDVAVDVCYELLRDGYAPTTCGPRRCVRPACWRAQFLKLHCIACASLARKRRRACSASSTVVLR
jgi:hypothetical protein